MKHKWFREWGWLYYPISWQGLILVLLVLIFWVQVFLAIDHHSHSVSDTFYGIYPFFVATFFFSIGSREDQANCLANRRARRPPRTRLVRERSRAIANAGE